MSISMTCAEFVVCPRSAAAVNAPRARMSHTPGTFLAKTEAARDSQVFKRGVRKGRRLLRPPVIRRRLEAKPRLELNDSP